ncbi:MAG: hypothetical protein ACPGAN_05110 [Candidatus Poseidoniaceae archaeon]
MSGERPKSSLVGLSDLGLSGYNTLKIRGLTTGLGNLGTGMDLLDSNVSQLSQRFNSEFEKQRSHRIEQSLAIDEIRRENMAGILEIQRGLSGIDSRLSGIEDRIEKIDHRNEQAALLRLLVKNTEDQVKKIKQISGEFLEFAALMSENLVVLADKEEIQIYTYLSGEDLRWAREVLQSVKEVDSSLQKLLRE